MDPKSTPFEKMIAEATQEMLRPIDVAVNLGYSREAVIATYRQTIIAEALRMQRQLNGLPSTFHPTLEDSAMQMALFRLAEQYKKELL